MGNGGILEARLRAYKKQAQSAKGKKLEVGIFENSTYPEKGKTLKVAQVAFWNEFGVPENNQPPRPFFRSTISNKKNDWADKVAKWLKGGMTIEQIMAQLGQDITVDIKETIATLTEPPLSNATVAAKKKKKSLHPTKPLMDTEVMYNAINWNITDGD
ncbi:hypothetical protein RCS94_06460 [Orbaceae bacterium ac157xtp]